MIVNFKYIGIPLKGLNKDVQKIEIEENGNIDKLLEKIIEKHTDVHGKRYDIKNIGKITGKEIYSSDVNIPGQLYAVVLRSPPHTEIKKVDYTEAEKMGMDKPFK